MIFDRYWKPMSLASLLILVVSLMIRAGNVASTGFPMERDVELTGGKRVSFITDNIDIGKVEDAFPGYEVRLYRGTENSLVITMPYEADENAVIDAVKANFQVIGEPTVQSIGPAIGEVFWQQAQTVMIMSFILMTMMVFLLFRSFVPSAIVLLSAITDMTGTMAILSLLGVPLSLPVFAAMIMIVAYSVDTDILLTSSMLKMAGGSAWDAMKTGLTMTSTTFTALLALYFISGSALLQTMALVLMIGILVDIPVTWFTNAGLLRLWLERKKGN